MFKRINLSSSGYRFNKPFPYYSQDDILNDEFAKQLQKEILDIPREMFDRYENPFEQKYTLRDKFKYPKHLNDLILHLESDEFVQYLSGLTGYSLIVDSSRNFNGVHLYNNGDKLDIHVDADIHPTNGLYKTVTLGIYLSSNWKPDYGCELEIWDGDSSKAPEPKLHKMFDKIAPIFNRLVIFTNNDYAWHGNPNNVKCPDSAMRIFFTTSYLTSPDITSEFKRPKAFFIALPHEPKDEEKDKLRIMRADPLLYKNVYRTN